MYQLFILAVLFGYPPKELPDYNPLLTLESLGIKSGDTLTLGELKSDRQRAIELGDVKETQPTTSNTTSSTLTSTSLSYDVNSNDRCQKSKSANIMFNSIDTSGSDSRGKSVMSSGTKRELDHLGRAETSNSHKRAAGKLSRK